MPPKAEAPPPDPETMRSRVRQSFTNSLGEVTFVSLEIVGWLWLVLPGETVTIEFDQRAIPLADEPLSCELVLNAHGGERGLQLIFFDEGSTEPRLWINGEPLLQADGSPTEFGMKRLRAASAWPSFEAPTTTPDGLRG